MKDSCSPIKGQELKTESNLSCYTHVNMYLILTCNFVKSRTEYYRQLCIAAMLTAISRS